MTDHKQTLLDFASALQRGAAAIADYENLAKRFKALDNDLNKLREEYKLATGSIRNCTLLINAYQDAHGKLFKICPACSGDGGFYFEGGPGEVGHEPCNRCESKGIITD